MSCRSSFRSTFHIYDGGPSLNLEKRRPQKLKEQETRAQFNKKVLSIEEHCQTTKLFLEEHISRWKRVCTHLERSSKEACNTRNSSPLIPTSTTESCSKTLGLSRYTNGQSNMIDVEGIEGTAKPTDGTSPLPVVAYLRLFFPSSFKLD